MKGGNLNVTREDSSKPDANPTQYGYGDRAAYKRPPKQSWLSTADPRNILVVGFLVLAFLLIFGGVGYWQLNRWCETHYSACMTLQTYAPPLVFGALPFLLLSLFAYAQWQRFSVGLHADMGEARRMNTERDRWGNLIDLDAHAKMPAKETVAREEREFNKTLAFEQAVAHTKQYAGINVLTEGNKTSVETNVDAIQAPAVESITPIPGEPILKTLKDKGIVCRSNNSVHIGNNVEDGKPHYMEEEDMGFLLIGGKTRTGKTTRVRYLLCQMVLMGWRLVICDKHATKKDGLYKTIRGLEDAFELPAAKTPEEINERIREVDQIGKDRLSILKDDPNAVFYPIILVVDEYTNGILRGDIDEETQNILMSIAIEYAGVNIHGVLIGHDWSSSSVGKERGAAIRRVTTHRIAHTLDRQGAQFLLPTGTGSKAEGLPKGQAVYVDENAQTVVVDCPFMTDEDVQWAADHIGDYDGGRTRKARPRLFGSYTDGGFDSDAFLAEMMQKYGVVPGTSSEGGSQENTENQQNSGISAGTSTGTSSQDDWEPDYENEEAVEDFIEGFLIDGYGSNEILRRMPSWTLRRKDQLALIKKVKQEREYV